MKINDAVKEIHALAVEKGWWDSGRSTAEIVALCHSELSEALEEDRNHKPPIYFTTDHPKPEGIAVELADCVIRIMDYFGYCGWNLEQVMAAKIAYNRTREHKHGGKKY